MFTWGWNLFADKWEGLLTDEDGKYCELMAGAYSDDQPDFTWLAPYETKRFSQYWYPTRSVGYVDFANLDGAVALDKENGLLRLNVTREITGGKLVLREGDKKLLEETIELKPCHCACFPVDYTQGKHTVALYDADGIEVLSYSEFEPDAIHIPKDNPGIPTPDKLFSAQDNYLAGAHLDQYRDPWLKPDIYYEEALKYDPRHLPSLIALGEYRYRTAQFDEAQRLLQQAMEIQNRYNSNPKDGTAGYLLGLCYLQKDELDRAYSTFLRSAWSYNSVSRSNTRAAMIDGLRKDYAKMMEHVQEALDKESTNPLAGPFAAYAMYKLGNVNAAKEAVEKILKNDCMNQLARYIYILFHNLPLQEFYSPEKMNSNPAQTCIDVAFDLANAGIINEAIQILEGLWEQGKASTMSLYCLAYFRQQLGREDADLARRSAQKIRIPDVYPYRLDELRVLRAATTADPADGTAWNLLGCILYDKKHYHEAAECWEKAIENAPDFYVPYRSLAVAYFSHLGRTIDALELTKKALSLKPNDDHLLCEVSFLMAAIGEAPEKRAEFIAQRIREESTDDVYKELIYAYNAAGNYEKAMETILCHVYTPGEGGEAFGIDSYMLNYIARGRKAMAKGAYEEALALFEDSLRIPENLNEAFPNASVAVPAYYYQVLALNKEAMNCPVFLANDATCAVMGELHAGYGKQYQNFLMITLGTGVGGGIVIDGKPYFGSRGGAGEIGHIIINYDGKRCRCGQVGCIEQYASVTALIQQTQDAAEQNPQSVLAQLCSKGITGRTVFEASVSGCKIADQVIDQYTGYIAAGITSLIRVFQPEAIILGGAISNQGSNLLLPIQKKITLPVEIKISELKNDAGLLGAAAIACK